MIPFVNVVISHTTAARYWLEATEPPSILTAGFEHVPWGKASEISWPQLPIAYDMTRALDILVPDPAYSNIAKGIRTHVWKGALPAGSLAALGEGVYITSPALTFIQMAATMDFYETVMFGLHLCASHTVIDGRILSRKPLATIQEITLVATLVAGRDGAKKGREALKFLAEGSASPRESELYMLLCMGRMRGSYNIERGTMNHVIPLTSQAASFTGKSSLRCDLYWPDHKVGLEYDSDAYHLAPGKIEQDAIRRNALQHMGIKVVTAGRMQLNSPRLFDAVAREVAHALGKRIREPFSPPEDKVKVLRDRLAPENRWSSLR